MPARIVSIANTAPKKVGSAVSASSNIDTLAVRTMVVGNIAALMEDITRDSKILITRVGIIRTREPAISMGVTNTEALPLRFTAANETELEILSLFY
jgi:hypothetical protein